MAVGQPGWPAAGGAPSADCDVAANGDLNGDGTVSLLDALILARSVA